jgi:hypothetical protein
MMKKLTVHGKISVRTSVLPFFFALGAFILSMIILPLHTGSDQIIYRKVYEALPGLSFLEGFIFFTVNTSSREPGYFLLVYVFSHFMNKDLLMSFLNAAIGYYLSLWLIRKKISWHVIILLSLNYYLIVLFFAAERLKLSLLLALLALAYSRGLFRYLLWGGSILSQMQTALLILSMVTANIVASLRPLFRGKLRFRMLFSLIGLFFLALLLFFLREHIIEKLPKYIEKGGITELIKPLVFTGLTLYYAKYKRVEAFVMQAPMIIASFVVGGERIVIFSYFIFMFYALQFRRGSNLGVFLPSSYFFVKGIIYIINTILYGQGLLDKVA